MKPLFSKSSLTILESYSFAKTIYAFDFDGTLAPIVADPEKAFLNKATEKLLARFCELAPVAIISGRSTSDVKKRLGAVRPQFIIGNHGLEGIKTKSESLGRAEADCRAWKKILTAENLGPGVEMEDKIYSLTLHYRKSRHKKKTLERIEGYLKSLRPAPRVVAGKCVLNLIPREAPHKGMALVDLLNHFETQNGFYIGDDVTDEDVFRMATPPIFTVSVGNKKTSEARYFIREQQEIDDVLKHLIHFHVQNQQAQVESYQ